MKFSLASVVDELQKDNEVRDSLRKKISKNPEGSAVKEAKPTGPSTDEVPPNDEENLRDFTEDDLEEPEETEDDYEPGYNEDDLIDLEEDEEELTEEEREKRAYKLLEKTSSKLEGLVDDLMEVNTDKEYSKLIKLLQQAARLCDELLQTEDYLED